MNSARLDARSMSENDLNNAVNAMPFLAKRRLVLLANPSAKYNNPSTRKKFFEFLEKAPETVRLVLYESVEPREADKHWLNKWAEKNSNVIQTKAFMLPRLKDMTGWIVNETRSQGGQIEPRAAEMLKEMVGVDTRQAGWRSPKCWRMSIGRGPLPMGMWKRFASSHPNNRCLISSTPYPMGIANPPNICCIVCSRLRIPFHCGAWLSASSVC
jgi:hypothetical protein